MLLRRRRGASVTLALVALTGMCTVTGCGSSHPAAQAPALRVVASNFAMTELVRGVGGPLVAVSDLAQGAPDDRTLVPDAAQVSALHSAQLIVEVGGGWQPSVEAVAGRGPNVVALGHQGSATGSQVWLDPVAMESAAKAVGSKLEALDPKDASRFENGVRDFNDNMYSISVDYQSSLSDCEYTALYTPDSAFAAMATQYGLHLHTVAAEGGSIALDSAAASAATQSFHGVFAEPPLPSPQMAALAARGKGIVGQLDTMDGPPIKAEPATSTYVDRLEANLSYLTGALYCQDGNGP